MHRNSNEIIDCRQTAFLMILPRIQSQAWNAFQGLSFDLKQELQSEVVGHCWKSFIKLFELGRHEDVSTSMMFPQTIVNAAWEFEQPLFA